MEKLSAMFDLFRKGSALSDPGALQSTSLVAAFLVACGTVASAFGYNIPMDTETAATIAAGGIALVHIIVTLISSKSVGLPAKSGTTDAPTAVNNSANTTTDILGDFPKIPGAD